MQPIPYLGIKSLMTSDSDPSDGSNNNLHFCVFYQFGELRIEQKKENYSMHESYQNKKAIYDKGF